MTTETRIYNEAIKQGMPDSVAKLMVAQSKLECNNYKHKFFTQGNNAFGFMYDANSTNQIKKGSNADNGLPIAQYSSVEKSVKDVTDWIKRRQKTGQFPKNLSSILTPLQYTKHLRNESPKVSDGKVYGGNSTTEYANGINLYFKNVAKNIAGNSFVAILFIVGFLSIIFLTNKI